MGIGRTLTTDGELGVSCGNTDKPVPNAGTIGFVVAVEEGITLLLFVINPGLVICGVVLESIDCVCDKDVVGGPLDVGICGGGTGDTKGPVGRSMSISISLLKVVVDTD